jgi:hypothetical protein
MRNPATGRDLSLFALMAGFTVEDAHANWHANKVTQTVMKHIE